MPLLPAEQKISINVMMDNLSLLSFLQNYIFKTTRCPRLRLCSRNTLLQ